MSDYVDVITEWDEDKAVRLYQFLSERGCIDINCGQLSEVVEGNEDCYYAYKIYLLDGDRYEYCSCLDRDEVTNPITLNKFMERTVRL
jgi:hypothetical protein